MQLECNDCHRPAGIDQPWPYGSPTPMEPASRVNLAPLQPHVSARAYMQPIRYYEHCSSCHPLLSDPRIGEPVPHKKPEIVISFLESHLQTYVAGHPEELRAEPPEARITRERSTQPPRRATEWVRTRLEESERLLWSKTCAECHTLDGVGVVSVPRIREARLTARWLERGDFDHASHKMLACAGCHTAVTSSERTSDVLIPRIRICRSCHDAGSSSPPARADCYECHRYHDWSKEKPRHGNLGPPVS